MPRKSVILQRLWLVVVLLIIWPVILFAATINATTDGNWTAGGSWAGGTPPGATDDATTSNNVDLTIQSTDNETVRTFVPGNNASLTVDAGGEITIDNLGNDALTVNNNFTLNVDGTMTINGNLVVNNNLVLNITGDLIVNGDIIIGIGANLSVSVGGTLTVDGDFTAGNNTDIDVEGFVDISGATNVGSGSTLTGGGQFSTGGGCTGPAAFCESSTLPVKLLFFKATPVFNYVKVEWATYEQENFDYFCLERSSSGLEFDCIAQIPGEQNSVDIDSYSWNDNSPVPGRSYYRLKAVDLDGSIEYFNVIRVDLGQESSFSVFPNPSNGNFILRLNQIPSENTYYSIYDLKGNLYFNKKLESHQEEINSNNTLAPGIYYIKLENNEGILETRKLLVN